MPVSIIIPTLNAEKTLDSLLCALISQNSIFEIIIIDSSSTDNTPVIAKKYGAKIISIPRNSFNHGRARNLAAMAAKGDILVFMTQDAIPQNNYLINNLISPLTNTDIAASYARHIPKEDASPTETFARYFNYPDYPLIKDIEQVDKLGIKTFFFSNSCSAIKRHIFFEVGMFSEDIKSNEDMILAAKIIIKGYKIAYVPDALIYHSHKYRLLDLFKRYYNIGTSLKKNKWIFQYARSEREGFRFLSEQLKFLIKKNAINHIPYMLMETFMKYMGYKIGLIIG